MLLLLSFSVIIVFVAAAALCCTATASVTATTIYVDNIAFGKRKNSFCLQQSDNTSGRV